MTLRAVRLCVDGSTTAMSTSATSAASAASDLDKLSRPTSGGVLVDSGVLAPVLGAVGGRVEQPVAFTVFVKQSSNGLQTVNGRVGIGPTATFAEGVLDLSFDNVMLLFGVQFAVVGPEPTEVILELATGTTQSAAGVLSSVFNFQPPLPIKKITFKGMRARACVCAQYNADCG